MNDLVSLTRELLASYGQKKEMGNSSPAPNMPHYFLLRPFLADNDLLMVLNTKRCRYQCHFCQLPAKSSKSFIPEEMILAQIAHVFNEMRHALSVLDRVTVSNEGSLFDQDTCPLGVLRALAAAARQIPRLRRLVLETRVEFVTTEALLELRQLAGPNITLDILTGFESASPELRDKILGKKEPLPTFEAGLDRIAAGGASLTPYVLFKPSPKMSDAEAYAEASASIDYLVEQCGRRGIPLVVRLNPMYSANGSRWAREAAATPNYQPPRLSDVARLADEKTRQGVSMYIGLSTEGLNDGQGTFMAREDFSPKLIKPIILFNGRRNSSPLPPTV